MRSELLCAHSPLRAPRPFLGAYVGFSFLSSQDWSCKPALLRSIAFLSPSYGRSRFQRLVLFGFLIAISIFFFHLTIIMTMYKMIIRDINVALLRFDGSPVPCPFLACCGESDSRRILSPRNSAERVVCSRRTSVNMRLAGRSFR